MSCCLRVLCYRNRTQAADGRLLSRVPGGLEPPIGICSTRPSDTIVMSRIIVGHPNPHEPYIWAARSADRWRVVSKMS